VSTGDEGRSLPANDLDDEASSRPDDLERLRDLLFARERRALADLGRRFDQLELTPEEVAELLPEAIAVRAAADDQLARALAPTIEKSFDESVERDPERIASAVYPVLGPAVRRAIAEALSGLVATINQALEHSFSARGLRWRLEAWRTGMPFAQIVLKHALVFRVEQVFLIHAETGLLLAHVSHDPGQGQDADLVSGMLTAIRDFVQDSFEPGGDGALRSFSVGELTVMVEAGPRALLAAAVRGEPPPELRERFQHTLENVHFRFPRALKEFEGDAEPFAPAAPMLAECLETVLETSSATGRSWAPRLAWLLLAMLLALGGAWWWRAAQRFDRLVAALRAEPGLVVLEAERGWRRSRVSGLRDPLARPVDEVLSAAGVAPRRLDASFAPYYSLDEVVVLKRAHQVLAPPPEVSLALQEETLTASGSATEPWVASARGAAALLPGIAAFDVSAVSTALPEELDAARRAIEGQQILFGAGRRELEPETAVEVAAVAQRLRALLSTAQRLGYDVEVAIMGRADEIGSQQFNRSLSEQRANAVLEALVRGGVSPERLKPEGLGIADPLPADDQETFSRINRSVSFSVRLERAERSRAREP
jgi:OOP family OmpA-OmpF porin